MKEIFHKRKLLKTHRKIIEIHKIKFIKMLEKLMFTCDYTLQRLTPLLGSTLGFFSPFLVSTTSRLTLVAGFRGNYVATCSTALRSATEENESGAYVAVLCPSKVKQQSSTADCLKF